MSMKSQAVRAIDVLLFGPTMIAIGLRPGIDANARAFLVAGGLLTILYNGANWLAVARGEGCNCNDA